MSTVSDALQSSVALKSVVASMNLTDLTMERLNVTSNKLNLGQSFEIASKKIGLVNIGLDFMSSEIVKSADEQENLNEKVKEGSKEAKILKDVFDKLGGFETIKKVVKISDEWVQSSARLELIVDDGGSVEDLRNKIFSSAQSSRTLYKDMVSSITKLGLSAGDSFNNTDEIIKFTEMIQKMGTISGLSAPEMSSVTDQINQAMSSGGLQGGDYESIIENMPILEQAIANYTGISSDKLKELAYQGKITSDIIKSAMFSVSSEVNEKFKQMPMTWGQVWNSIVNRILIYSQPILDFISLLANNWSIIEPIILRAAAAWGIYTIAVGIAEIAQKAITIAKIIGTAITWIFTRATLSQAAAQRGLNKALYECPLVWIIMIIIAVIAIIYLAVSAINKLAGTSTSAAGLIAGIFMWLMALLGNIFIGGLNAIIQILWILFVEPFLNIAKFFANIIEGGFDNFGAGVANLIGNIISWFLSLGRIVTTIIDAIFGTKWTDGLNSMQESVLKWGKNDKAKTYLDGFSPKIDYRFDMTDAYNSGYKFGENIDKGINDSFKFDDLGLDKISDKKDISLNPDNLGNVLDNQEYDVNVKDEVNLADESLKYLLDEVTQKYINNINLQAPAPNVNVQIDVENGSDLDLDAIAEKTKQKLGVEIVEFAMSSTDIRH